MTHDEYCIQVCKGACCNHTGVRCPHLLESGACGIYHLWKDNWCHYHHEPNKAYTVPIKEALDKDLLPKEIVEKCCYAHPELLNKEV